MTSTDKKMLSSNNHVIENQPKKINFPVEHSKTPSSPTVHDVTQNDSQNDLTQKKSRRDEIPRYCKELQNPANSFITLSSDLNYQLLWSLGLDSDVGFINLSDSKREDICFVTGENLVLFNLVWRVFRILPGHVYPIRSLARDASGQYLMTSSLREIIVWDSYLAKPILSLSADIQPNASQDPFDHAIVSEKFQYIWGINPRQIYVWNVSLIRRNTQSNFVHTLARPIENKIVAVLVDPDNDNYLVVISQYEVHFLSVELGDQEMDQEFHQNVSEYTARKSAEFTCGVFKKGTSILYIGTQDGSITEWTEGESQTNNAIESSYKKQFLRKIKLPYYTREDKRDISVTALLCTDKLVIVGTSHGEITFLTCNLQLLYWVKGFGISVVKTLRMRRTNRDIMQRSTEIYQDDCSDESNIRADISKRVFRVIGSSESMPASNMNSEESSSSGDLNSNAEVEEFYPVVVHKHNLEMFREPNYCSTDSKGIPVDDIIVLGDQEELTQIDFTKGLYWTILEPKLTGVTHITFHPRRTLLYVLCEHNTLEVIDWGLQQRLKRKGISTSPDVGVETNTCKQRQKMLLCEVLNERKAPAEKQEEVTCLQCAIILQFTLLLCGLDSGIICVLDGETLTTLYRLPDSPTQGPVCSVGTREKVEAVSFPKEESNFNHISVTYTTNNIKKASISKHDCISIHSPVISILSTEDSTVLAALHDDGTISIYDMLELTEMRLVTHYRAHDKVTDLLIDDASADGTTVISIGTDRMCYICRVTKTLNIDGSFCYDSCARIYRIEQIAQPLFIRNFPRDHFTVDVLRDSLTPRNDLYLTGNSEYKYRFYTKSSMACVKTVQSPLLRSPITDFRLVPSLNAAIFTTQTEIGVHGLPLTPLAHGHIYFTLPKSTDRFCLLKNSGYFVTVGKGKYCDSILLWQIAAGDINSPSRHFEVKHELVPYYEMIPGGCYGHEYTNIKDTFVYFTIQGACHKFSSKEACLLSSQEIGGHTTIAVCDLPFILSALGFFPSEFDLENLNNEIKLMGLEELDFQHFLVLYLNHRPVRDVSYEEVLRALEFFVAEDSLSSSGCTLTTDASSISSENPTSNGKISNPNSHGSQYINSRQKPGSKTIEKPKTTSRKADNKSGNAINKSEKGINMSGNLRNWRGNSEKLPGKPGVSGQISANIPHLFGFGSKPYLTKSELAELLKNWSEVKWTDDQADQCVGFLFGRDDSLEVTEIASRLVARRSIPQLNDEGITIYG